jgi:hypothetical protein
LSLVYILNQRFGSYEYKTQKMVWSMVLAAECVTATGAFNGWPIMGIASVILGGIAITMALLLKQQMEKIKLSPKLAMELR